MSEQENPAQWASFDHVGIWYTNHSKERIENLSVPAIYIQRWWRQRGKTRKRLYPILRAKTVHDSAIRLNGDDPFLSQEFRATEKLDGTNLGVRCDGALFGRRFRVYGDKYQTVPLVGIVPVPKCVQGVKETLLSDAGGDAKLILYGELMCNPRKFNYTQRSMGHKFYCFGAMIQTEQCTNVLAELQEKGFVAYISKTGLVRVTLNEVFGDLLKCHGIPVAPILDKGSFRELCFRTKQTLMKNGMEGVVLAGDSGILFKWKSLEDESKAHQVLCSLLKDHSRLILELAGVDVPLVKCLVDVATTCKTKDDGAKSTKNKTKLREPPNVALHQALTSAMSKYDALETYFQKEERAFILECLKKELVDDLGASTSEEYKCIDRAVGKEVGIAYGKWKSRS